MTDYGAMSEQQVEELLRKRADEQGCELLIEAQDDGKRWRVSYVRQQDFLPDDDKTVYLKSAETTGKRQALIGLAMLDEIEDEMGQ